MNGGQGEELDHPRGSVFRHPAKKLVRLGHFGWVNFGCGVWDGFASGLSSGRLG